MAVSFLMLHSCQLEQCTTSHWACLCEPMSGTPYVSVWTSLFVWASELFHLLLHSWSVPCYPFWSPLASDPSACWFWGMFAWFHTLPLRLACVSALWNFLWASVFISRSLLSPISCTLTLTSSNCNSTNTWTSNSKIVQSAAHIVLIKPTCLVCDVYKKKTRRCWWVKLIHFCFALDIFWCTLLLTPKLHLSTQGESEAS